MNGFDLIIKISHGIYLLTDNIGDSYNDFMSPDEIAAYIVNTFISTEDLELPLDKQ